MSIETFRSSANLPKIWNDIQDTSPLQAEDKTLHLWQSALVEIALDNLLCM